jgi:hypothetical protein
MPNNNERGRAGTISVEEFDSLKEMATQYGAVTLASKVGKICSRKAEALLHECSSSAVGDAFNRTASKLSDALRDNARKISSDSFRNLADMVDRYGAEVITWKLAKLASRSGQSDQATLLKGIFPRAS